MAGPPRISVVIPTFGREALLCRCIADVLRQDHPAFEVIVVDQSSGHLPETEAFLQARRDRIRHVRVDRPALMGALNVGLGLVRGELVWLTDDDVQLPDPALLHRHEAVHADASIGGVAGYEHDSRRPEGSPYDPRSTDEVWGWYHTSWNHPVRAEVVTAPGCNVSFKRHVLVQVGGFDERFTGNAVRWENDLCLRVRRAGYRVVFEPDAKVIHQPSASPGGCENRHLLSRDPASHDWYVAYFRNMLYVTVKHMPPRTWPQVLWRLYRSHVMNRPFVRQGGRFLLARHRALVEGLAQALEASRGWRRVAAGS